MYFFKNYNGWSIECTCSKLKLYIKNYNFRENFKDIVKNQTFLNEKSK